MRFSIFTGNHNAGMHDLAEHLKHSLESAGHAAAFSRGLVRGTPNILVENFGPKLLEMAIGLAASGTPLVLWGTEEITGETFNLGVAPGHAHYDLQEMWQLRHDNFATVAEHAAAIWVPVETLVEPYGRLAPGVPVRCFPHGYTEGWPRVEHRPEAAKDIDFYFSGTPTAHRRGILEALAARHKVVSHHHEVPEDVRRDYLARAKVCLSLRLGPQTRLPSVSRMHALVMNRCFVLHEQCPQPSHLDPFVNHVAPEALLDACEGALRLPDRAGRAQAMLDRLRRDLPMKEIVPRLLDEAFPGR